jgi:hypothetical protein
MEDLIAGVDVEAGELSVVLHGSEVTIRCRRGAAC